MKIVSDQRLLRRNGMYYYRRRVPTDLISKFGKKVVQFSLHTTSFKEAKKLRTLKDLEWDARFETAGLPAANAEHHNGAATAPLTAGALIELVRAYVEREDARAHDRASKDPPRNAAERTEMRIDTEIDLQALRDRTDQNAHASVSRAGEEILGAVGKTWGDEDIPGEAFAEYVRRGLLELDRRWLARLNDDHQRPFFDELFDLSRPAPITFGALAEQYLLMTEEEAAVNGHSRKWVDKQRASLSLIREIVGDGMPVGAVDYDRCLGVRSMLARLPANRTKIYGVLPLDKTIELAAKEGRTLLSPVTEQQYLGTLRDVLDLAAKKRLISVNPAEGLKPIRRDTVAAGEKRRPFTLQQIADFFGSAYYAQCAKHPLPFAHDKAGWRFWLPLICLFTGMRPNEAAQMHLGDLRCTDKGTSYFDIVATTEDDEDDVSGVSAKTLNCDQPAENSRPSATH